MSTLLQRLEALRRDTMEQAVIDSIPQELRDNMAKADAEFKAKGGCPGCKSPHIGVHYGRCPTLDADSWY